MSMQGVFPKSAKTPTFNEVGVGQFFVSNSGWLCQKINATGFNFVARPNGVPNSFTTIGNVSLVVPKETLRILREEQN